MNNKTVFVLPSWFIWSTLWELCQSEKQERKTICCSELSKRVIVKTACVWSLYLNSNAIIWNKKSSIIQHNTQCIIQWSSFKTHALPVCYVEDRGGWELAASLFWIRQFISFLSARNLAPAAAGKLVLNTFGPLPIEHT